MRRTAVIDLGSNSFRLVVYEWEPGGEWSHGDQLREPVRIGAGLDADGLLHADAIERALAATRTFAAFCGAEGIDDVAAVATSAIRDAANGRALVDRIRTETGIDARILSGEEEARYGYLAVVNATALSDGFAIDMGGGSIQLMCIEARDLRDAVSLPLGAVRVSERFLPGEEASSDAIDALRAHVRERVAALGWWGGSGQLVAIGGNPRNLASAARKRAGADGAKRAAFTLERGALEDLIEVLAARPASRRGEVPGVKADRGDVILGAALVLETVIDVGGFAAVTVSRAGLREGVFFERFLGARAA